MNYAEVSNTSPQNRKLRISGTSSSDSWGKLDFTRNFNIPSMSSRVVEFAFHQGKINADTSKNNMNQTQQTYLLFDSVTGQQVGLCSRVSIPVEENKQRFSVIYGDSLQFDSSAYLSQDKSGLFGDIKLISAGRIGDLPDRWYAWSMLDVAMLNNVNDSSLKPSQKQAFEGWLRNGGTVVLFGGYKTQPMLNGYFGRLAGVTCVGNHMTDILEIDSKTLKLDSPTWMAEIVPAGAKVLARNGELPLLTCTQVGKGRVFVLACQLAAAKPVKEADFNIWSEIRDLIRTKGAIDTSMFAQNVTVRERVTVKNDKTETTPSARPNRHNRPNKPNAKPQNTRTVVKESHFIPGMRTLQAIAGRKTFNCLLPVGVVVGFAVFTVLFGALLRIKRRGELLWMFLVPLALLAGFGAFKMGRVMGDPQRLTNVGMITSLGDSTVNVQQFYAYYSGPNGRTLSFASQGSGSFILPAGATSLAGIKTTKIETGDTGMIIPDQSVNSNAIKTFYTNSIEEIPTLTAELGFNSAGFGGIVNNEMKYTIGDAVVFVNGVSLRMGTLKPGRNTVTITNIDELGSGEFASSLVQQDTKWNELLESMLSRGGFNSRLDMSKPMIIGYIDSSLQKPIDTKNVQVQGTSVLVLPVKYVTPKSGTEITIPRAFVDIEFRNPSTPVWNEQTREFSPSPRDGQLLVVADAPAGVGELKKLSADVDFSIQAQNYTADVYLAKIDPSDKHHRKAVKVKLVKSYNKPVGSYSLTIDDIQPKMLDNGKLVLLVDVKKARDNLLEKQAKELNLLGTQSGIATWKMVSFAVTMKGTVK